MSIIQKCLSNQIAANEIITVMTPYCPTPQHLLHLKEGVNLLSLKTLVNQNILDTYIKSSWPHYLQWYEVGWKNIVVIWSSLFTNRHLINNCTCLSCYDIKYLYWPKKMHQFEIAYTMWSYFISKFRFRMSYLNDPAINVICMHTYT